MAPFKALFPLDGSEQTFKAVETGLQVLSGVKDAQATFLVVISKKLRDMPASAREHLTDDDDDEVFIRDDEAQEVIDQAKAIAKKAKFAKVEGKIAIDDVKRAILAEAGKHHVLVMHRLDRDEKREHSHNSLTEALAREALCDVWLINA